jgi:dihydrodipicolinate synthase/N-acetylneuraminate lyase
VSASVIQAIRGVVPIVPTPFRADESIDLDALGRCVQFAAKCDFGAVCLPAYGSEFYKLGESERFQVVETAIAASGGRTRIIAQSNHGASRVAADFAKRFESMGASAISFALPRQFHLREHELLEFARRICESTQLPVLVQDFFPGGSCVGGEFAAKLHEACPNFQFLKLEEPLAGPKIRDIVRATDGRVGVLAGWGGMYVMELIPNGIIGLMPGLGVSDVLKRVWDLAYRGEREVAMDTFQTVLPQLVFSLQNLELWLFLEKKLLAARGVIPEASAFLRHASINPDPVVIRQGLWLNERILRALDRFEMARSP